MQSGSSTEVLVFILMLFVWACFGYWGGRIAQGKGYSFGLGFAVGFFGGIIGVVILYVIGPARRARDRRQQFPPPTAQYFEQPPPPRTKVCQQCHNLVEGDAQFCNYCGARV